MQQCLACFARLVRVLLGPTSIADAKLGCGKELCILGVDLSLSWRGYQCRPSSDKVVGWLCRINKALGTMRLSQGDASKLAGKLSWGGSAMFHRFGRAMLRPIFDQKTRRDGRVDSELKRALEWWRRVLTSGLSELREWSAPVGAPIQLFCDASGRPPHMGAVVFVDNRCWWTHSAVEDSVLSRFRARKDNQIMGLELLAISMAFCTFDWLLRGRTVVVHCDNTGSEVRHLCACVSHCFCFLGQASFRRGTARCWDYAQLVHEQRLQAAIAGMQVFITRVATDDNIADLPSRDTRQRP